MNSFAQMSKINWVRMLRMLDTRYHYPCKPKIFATIFCQCSVKTEICTKDKLVVLTIFSFHFPQIPIDMRCAIYLSFQQQLPDIVGFWVCVYRKTLQMTLLYHTTMNYNAVFFIFCLVHISLSF